MARDNDTPAGPRKLGARQCVWLAVLLYAVVFLALVALLRVIDLIPSVARDWNQVFIYLFELPEQWSCLGKAVFVVLPLAVYVVGIWSWDTYLLAAGERLPMKPSPKVWAAFGFLMLLGAVLAVTAIQFGALLFVGIPFLLQSARRKKFQQERPATGCVLPLLYATLPAVLLPHRMSTNVTDTIVILVAVSVAAFLVWDCLYVDLLALIRARRRLKGGGDYRMQFSLGALMAAVLLFTGYVTGLVLIFR